MKSKYKDIELLAPVGSFESLAAAINAGANSIYFGVESLNMRSRSSFNFTLSHLKKIVDKCSKYEVNSYLALNTIIYDHDLKQAKKIIYKALDNNIDALIISDPSVLMLTQNLPIKVHLSTQLNICNLESVKFWSKYADVMVLARELSLDQISFITNQINRKSIKGKSNNKIKIEVFIHGALCMAISGKCFLSTHLHNAPANRGECYQICRRPFKATDDQGFELQLDSPYILSPKDLCTVPIIDNILKANVKILKIEGRGRSPEYVEMVVKSYRQAIDLCQSNDFTKEKVQAIKSNLDKVYNRGFWSGHYFGQNTESWNTDVGGSKSTVYKEYVGKIIKYFKKINVAEFQIESGSISKDDEILIIGPTTGSCRINANEIIHNNSVIPLAKIGKNYTMKIPFIVRPSDRIYKIIKRIK